MAEFIAFINKLMQKIVTPVIVFCVLIAVFILVALFVKNEIYTVNYERLVNKYEAETSVLLRTTDDKIEKYTLFLKSARGLFYAGNGVSRKDWNQYANTLDLKNNYSAVSAIEYIKRVPRAEKDAFVNSVRTDTSLVPGGYPGFDIKSDSGSGDYYVADYVEPMRGNEAGFGFDLFSVPARRKALELARDTDSAVITEPVTLLQEKAGQKAVLVVLPIYTNGLETKTLDQRRKNIQGFVVVAVRASDVFSKIILTNPISSLSGMSVTDITETPIVLLPYLDITGNPANSNNVPIVQQVQLNEGGRIWQIDFKSDKKVELSPIESSGPYILLGLGFLVSGLITLVLVNAARLRTRAEELAKELTKDLAKFKMAVDNSTDHIVITDPDGIVIYANEAVERITGFSVEEVLGKKSGSKELWGGEMDKSVYEKFWQRIKIDKKPFIGEFNNHRKNGEKYVVEAHVSPVLDSKGDVIFLVGIERDVTKAKEIDRMKTDFISLASHQLRTPLSAIKWFLEMLIAGDAGKLTKEQLEFASDIFDANERMISLINGLLNVSRIESGRLIVDPQPTDLKELINSGTKELKPKADAKKIKLVVKVGKLPIINIDPKLIREVLNNLITNSIKYSEHGSEVRISATEKGGDIICSIADNGAGIPKDEQSKIFGRFYRASNVIKKEPEGTGLGLYLAKSIVESSGGKIWFESTEGKGTTFWFTIPKGGMEAKAGEVGLS